MDDKDIVSLITEEENRLQLRKADIEIKTNENNSKFDMLVAKKSKVMEMASTIVIEEKEIQDSGAQVQELAGECQRIQDKLVQMQNGMPTATAEQK